MSIEIIAIASEVLSGDIVNTNASFISQALLKAGYQVSRHTVLPDEPIALEKGLKEALSRVNIVITTGGLGPTCDDLTRNVAAKLFDSDFHRDETVAADLKKRYGDASISLDDQATLPTKAHVLLNRVGTAPGLVFSSDKNTLILMPGVPIEMRAMCQDSVIPHLLKKFPPKNLEVIETLHLCLLFESAVDPLLRELEKEYPKVKIGIYPSHGTLSVRFSSEDGTLLPLLKKRMMEKFNTYIFESESGKIEEALQNIMVKSKKTLCLAESCTGGMMASRITAISGASEYFLGSLVVYSNELKNKLLDVSEETIKTKGSVSKEAVMEMLNGLFEKTSADFGIAVSGIAGPTGGTPQKPIGTIYAAIGERGKEMDLIHFQARGNRDAIILSSTNRLLSALWRKIAHNQKAVI